MLFPNSPPKSKAELLERCQNIEGLTLGQLALLIGISIPYSPLQRKGFAGTLVELALGASAKGKPLPDFHFLEIELKTLPINENGKVAESTFITSIPLMTIQQEKWKTSQCYKKLKSILWVPIEDNNTIPYSARRIGKAVLWSPNKETENILESDWLELTFMISAGRLEEINAGMGQYLQIRPKAANNKSLCYGINALGEKILTLPRGFYLRSSFTNSIVHLAI
ncbi:DNA mismatch repair protein MutH (plasmid) [Legionella adelaidensis]|uniref:DNA mismatch repair protein MutH n=1 Tax=Legionella adelaidensis TaxID=45056 RepID=A0A0W0R3Q2_9GAMM|nr:DNA mismatch repair endonuclease MutH [Legionella adelaidensis]KTC65673.1 DNA mismatch repair protein [Legionella adelaidensis]VEH85131.1 DNA mismatch repair protein MutH [Legionella adelaidensis]